MNLSYTKHPPIQTNATERFEQVFRTRGQQRAKYHEGPKTQAKPEIIKDKSRFEQIKLIRRSTNLCID